MLEDIAYPRVSAISLSFWLGCFLDMVAEANVKRDHGLLEYISYCEASIISLS